MLDFLIKKTKTYKKLKEKYEYLKHQRTEAQNQINRLSAMISKRDLWLEQQQNNLLSNKEIAEEILKTLKKLIKKEEIIQAQKDIEMLCNKIIGGEKC